MMRSFRRPTMGEQARPPPLPLSRGGTEWLAPLDTTSGRFNRFMQTP
jgi:hypothetical protein